MILAQNWPKTAKFSWQCPFKMLRNSDLGLSKGCLRLALKCCSGLRLLYLFCNLIKTKLNKILAFLSSHSPFYFLDFCPQIHSQAMNLCILFLSSIKKRSEHSWMNTFGSRDQRVENYRVKFSRYTSVAFTLCFFYHTLSRYHTYNVDVSKRIISI